MPLTYSIALLVLFILLLIAEFFVPSAGMVGIAAAIAGVTSIVVAFTHSLIAGVAVTGAIAISTPVILLAMVHYWPHTPIGRLILNRRPGQVDEPVESRLRSGETRKSLLGSVGLAKTDLLPSGLVVIDGQRLDAVSEGSPINAGDQVVVISTTAGKIRVRLAGAADIDPQKVQAERQTESIESALESLDLDALE